MLCFIGFVPCNCVLSFLVSGCPTGYDMVYNDHCYMLNKNKMTYDDAKAHCEQEGGYLANGEDREILDFANGKFDISNHMICSNKQVKT